jgi:hypothetical protein
MMQTLSFERFVFSTGFMWNPNESVAPQQRLPILLPQFKNALDWLMKKREPRLTTPNSDEVG